MKRFGAVSSILLLILTAQSALSAVAPEKRLNLSLKQAAFPEAIRRIFAGSKDKYVVDPALQNLKVTATLKNVTRDQAISVVTRTAGVMCSVQKGAYVFSPIAKSSRAAGTPAPAAAPALVKLFRLQYVGAGETAAMLNASPPDGLESITATSANTLLIKGDAEALSQSAELISALDSESALPRSVRVTLSLRLGATGQKEGINLTTESVGPEGNPMPLAIDFSNKEEDRYVMDVKLTPHVLPDGTVSLTGSGSIDCGSYGHAPNGKRIAKSFEVAASVTPDTPAVIASGSVDEYGHKIEFSALATAHVEKGRIVMHRAGQPTTSSSGAHRPFTFGPVLTEPSRAHRTTADQILQQIWNAQPGQGKFDAMDVVVRKYKESDLATRNAIVSLCLNYMKDTTRGLIDRWPCEYVLQRVRYEPAIPELIDVLHNDPAEVMRAVAAEALGMWHKGTSNNDILEALKQSQRTETNQRVQDVLAKYLGKKPGG